MRWTARHLRWPRPARPCMSSRSSSAIARQPRQALPARADHLGAATFALTEPPKTRRSRPHPHHLKHLPTFQPPPTPGTPCASCSMAHRLHGRLIAAEAAPPIRRRPSLAVVLAGRDAAVSGSAGQANGPALAGLLAGGGETVRRAAAEAEVVIQRRRALRLHALKGWRGPHPRRHRLRGPVRRARCNSQALDDQPAGGAAPGGAGGGAGHTATLSSLMLAAALGELQTHRGPRAAGRAADRGCGDGRLRAAAGG